MNTKRKIWITTDLHLGHAKMLEYCQRPDGFEWLIYKNLKVIGKDDILICLGDICMNDNIRWHDLFIKGLLCRKILIRGNHDHKTNNWYLDHGWDFVCEDFTDRYFGKRILFSHEAKSQKEGVDMNIHGHSHGKANGDKLCSFYDTEYNKEIALEKTDYKPVSLETFLNTK